MMTILRSEPSEAAAERLRARRGLTERLLDLSSYLSPSDAELLRAIYERGMSAAAIARAARRHPRAVRLRVQRLIERISSPTFQAVLAQHIRWPRQRRDVAHAVFLRGESQRKAAARLGLTVHQIRRETDRIRALIEAAAEPSRSRDGQRPEYEAHRRRDPGELNESR